MRRWVELLARRLIFVHSRKVSLIPSGLLISLVCTRVLWRTSGPNPTSLPTTTTTAIIPPVIVPRPSLPTLSVNLLYFRVLSGNMNGDQVLSACWDASDFLQPSREQKSGYGCVGVVVCGGTLPALHLLLLLLMSSRSLIYLSLDLCPLSHHKKRNFLLHIVAVKQLYICNFHIFAKGIAPSCALIRNSVHPQMD